ncbi:hypothetical protein DY000_02000119 [Brassica cretica]|uniref:Uncharacterized protein n=1 Tax=Brassica cretica TaxID=69181 RepID=A0ABQ7BXY0_BRACR|nr:hypothetical protein DY000_02000119 [Brassica cretica]
MPPTVCLQTPKLRSNEIPPLPPPQPSPLPLLPPPQPSPPPTEAYQLFYMRFAISYLYEAEYWHCRHQMILEDIDNKRKYARLLYGGGRRGSCKGGKIPDHITNQ